MRLPPLDEITNTSVGMNWERTKDKDPRRFPHTGDKEESKKQKEKEWPLNMQKTKIMCILEAKWNESEKLCKLLSQKIISKNWPLDLTVEATGDLDKWHLNELWKLHRN